jgi:hypothetical protein
MAPGDTDDVAHEVAITANAHRTAVAAAHREPGLRGEAWEFMSDACFR